MGLFKLPTKSSTQGIPPTIEFSPEYHDDSDTRMTGDDGEEFDSMTGRGFNSRSVGNSGGAGGGGNNHAPPVDPRTIGFRGKDFDMVGKGVNTRRTEGSYGSSGPGRGGEPASPGGGGGVLDMSDGYYNNRDSGSNVNNNNQKKPNPFDSDSEDSAPPPANKEIDDIMLEYERKMKHLVTADKFNDFGQSDDDDDSVLSGIEEEIGGSHRSGTDNNMALEKRKMMAKGGKSIKNLFGIKNAKNDNDKDPPQSFAYHREFDDNNSYISGEYDAEFDNSQGILTDNHNPRSPTSQPALGVPNPSGGQYTHRQLEDELYLYKLETLNLTDACRELAEQLDEAERKLESVQSQATFRIHALEAELQDGHVGMKSLVKMTSVEMDGRLEALRALGKTASLQAEKIKERDMELNRLDGKLRKTLRDIKVMKRENKKVKEEKGYLRSRLLELEETRDRLEDELARLTEEANNREMTRVEAEKMEGMKVKLNDTLEQVGYLKSQLEFKEKELEELRERSAGKEAEIERVKEDLALKENDVVRVELQLERVRKDLFDAAEAAKTAEEARVEAQSKETSAREELEEALAALEEVNSRVATLESNKDEMAKLMRERETSEDDLATIETHKAKISELEEEVKVLRDEREQAAKAVEAAKESYESTIAERQSEIETLTKDVEVHAEQMLLAQSMLDEKESLVADLRGQLDDVQLEYNSSKAQLEEDLASKTREASNIKVELDERINDVSRLEDMLTKLRSEVAGTPTIDTNAPETLEEGDKGQAVLAVSSSSTNLAEMEMKIERMERELASNKRQIDAAQIELDEKDKTTDRIRADLEKMRADKNARVEELENAIEDKNKTLANLKRELDESKQINNLMESRIKRVQLELEEAKDALEKAQEENQTSTNKIEESKAAAQAANHACEKLKTQVELLQKAKEELHSELVALRIERNNEQQSSTQAAAALAATNAARQAEMEMQIEKMQKDIDTKKREIDTIKIQLHEKDAASAQLKEEVTNLRNEMVHYKEKIQLEDEQKLQAMQAIAEKEYFEEDEQSLTSMNSSSRLGLFSRFTRSKNSVNASDYTFESDDNDKDKDSRIEQLEKSVKENVLIISNLKKELVSASSKFNKDESQRRMLIQRLENENQAYSVKLEVLENEFNELKKKRESANFDGNKSSAFDAGIEKMKNKSFGQSFFTAASDYSYDDSTTSDMSGVSAISGASKMHPLERDNKKLKKQKALYENRISSLQTQLSEIQQIIPELMSKSKAQIAKLDNTIKTQQEEAKVKEQNLNDEISALKSQNEQLQAATRSRLQASDMERQNEIADLKMRLEAKEATIAKLESLTGGKSKSFKKGGKLLRKKKNKSGSECENSILSGGAGSGVGGSISGSLK